MANIYRVEWERELDRHARRRITGLPGPLPHPDHVVIDLRACTARRIGPATKEEKAEWARWHDGKADFANELAEPEDMLRAEQDAKMRATLTDDIAPTRKVPDIIDLGALEAADRG